MRSLGSLLFRAGPPSKLCVTSCQAQLQRSYRAANVFRNAVSTAWKRSQVEAGYSHLSATRAADIHSNSNEYVKHCNKLRTNSQYRSKFGTVLLVGTELVQEVASYERPEGPLHIHHLLIQEGRQPPSDLVADRTSLVTIDVMRRLCGLQNADGVQAVAEIEMPKFADLSGASSPTLQRLLVLECIQDPGNLGTLLRTAVALGWEACFLLPGCCDPFNDKALKAGRGAAFKLPIAEGDWNELRKVLQKHSMQCYGASPYGEEDAWGSGTQQQRQSESEKSYESDGVPQERDNESDAVCLVLGSEGQGLSETAMKHSQPVAIPMTGPMESLNVSQAGAILLFALGGKSSDLYKQLRKLQ